MLRVSFLGELHPTHHSLSLVQAYSVNVGARVVGVPLRLGVTINDPSFEVRCDLPIFNEEMLPQILHQARVTLRSYIDVVSFATGVGVVIVWKSASLPNGIVKDMTRRNKTLASLCTAYSFPAKTAKAIIALDEILKLVLSDPHLLGCLTDLSDLLTDSGRNTTNCQRALDGMRNAIAPSEKRQSAGRFYERL